MLYSGGTWTQLIVVTLGGENISPLEVEERLLAHASIDEAAVVGVKHPRLGEQVVAFVRQAERAPRPANMEVSHWVQAVLARHKSPEHIFWIGDDGVGADFPKTASGKHQKHILRDIAMTLIGQDVVRPRL